MLQVGIVGQLGAPKSDINDAAGRFLSPCSRGAVPFPRIARDADVAVLRINLSAINHNLRTRSVVGHAEIRSGNRHAAAARRYVRPGVGCHVIFPDIVATPGCIATAKEHDPTTVRVVNHTMTASRAGLWSVRIGVEPVETLRQARQSCDHWRNRVLHYDIETRLCRVVVCVRGATMHRGRTEREGTA